MEHKKSRFRKTYALGSGKSVEDRITRERVTLLGVARKEG